MKKRVRYYEGISFFSKFLFTKGTIFIVFFMWILFGFNNNNADYQTYKRIFEGKLPNHEVGFIFITQFFHTLQWSYQDFLKLISFIILFILTIDIAKYCKNVPFVLILFILYPFFLNCVQYRSFFSMVIALRALPYLIGEKKIDILKYIILILLATSIHYIACFYLLLLLSKINIPHKQLFPSICVLSIFIAILIVTNFIQAVAHLLFSSIKVDNVLESRAQLGFIVAWSWHILGFILFQQIYNRHLIYINTTKQILSHKILKKIYTIQVLMLTLLPFYIITSSFFRLYQLSIILIYICAGNLYSIDKSNNKNLLLLLLTILYATLLGFYFYSGGIVQSILFYNYFVNLFL